MFSNRQQLPQINTRHLILWMILLLVLSFALKQAISFAPVFFGGERYHELVNRDFVNYWMAGRLTLSGELGHLFPTELYQAKLAAAFPDLITEVRGWSYPPHFILVCLPFGLLPYPVAYAAFMFLTLGFWVFASVKGVAYFAPHADGATRAMVVAFTLPFIVSQITLGQNGFLIGGAFILALIYRHDRPWITGLMLAILTMKPHLGVLWPVLLLIEKNWRAIFWGAGFTVAVLGLSVVVLGPEAWQAFISVTVGEQNTVVTSWEGGFLYMMPSWFGGLRALGLPAGPAIWVHLLIMIGPIAALIWAMTKADETGRSVLMAVGTFTTLPYMFSYDLGPLMLVAALCFMFIASAPADDRNVWVTLLLLLVMTLQIWMPTTVFFRESFMAPVVLLPALMATAFLLYTVWQVRRQQQPGR